MFSLFKKSKKDNTQKQQVNYRSLKVREVVKETADTVSIYFEQPEEIMDYQAGQYLTLILTIDGKEVRRSYSLCTSPFVDPFPGVSVKRVAGGLVSNYLNDQMKPGKTIEVMDPLGNFVTDYHSSNERHVMLFAGGSGITPLIAIAKSVLINEPKSTITLVYANRNEESIIFKKALEDLQEKYGKERLEIVHVLSQGSDRWEGRKGRLHEEVISEMISQYCENKNTEYFVCGPQGMMECVVDCLNKLKISEDKIKKESFYNAPSKDKKVSADKILTQMVTVINGGEENTFEVVPEKSILDAGLDENIDMPYSCQSGLCTACRGKLISGQVKMDEDAGLTKEELAKGYVLCCQAHPLTDDVKIEIG